MTDKLRAAAQQALEALLSTNQNNPRTSSAISALRTALVEQQEHQPWCASLTQLLMSNPPKPAPCNCKPKVEQVPPVSQYNLKRIAWELERTALAEQEPYDQTTLELCDVCGWKTLIPGDGCLNCERQPKAEQSANPVGAVLQKPVAWMSPGKERLEFSRKDTVYGSHTIPLYAAPQPAKREPLTNEQIGLMWRKAEREDDSWAPHTYVRFARAVEAAHGIGETK